MGLVRYSCQSQKLFSREMQRMRHSPWNIQHQIYCREVYVQLISQLLNIALINCPHRCRKQKLYFLLNISSYLGIEGLDSLRQLHLLLHIRSLCHCLHFGYLREGLNLKSVKFNFQKENNRCNFLICERALCLVQFSWIFYPLTIQSVFL